MSVVKKMSGTFVLSAFVALTSLAGVGCGGDDTDDKSDSGTEPGDGGGGGTCEGTKPPRSYTLISVLGNSAADSIKSPSHKVELIDVKTGKPLDPPVTAMTDSSGSFTISGVPCGTEAWVHVIGEGPASDGKSTYDSLSYGPVESGDTFIRISQVGTASTAETTGGFTADPERVAIGGAVYSVDATGKRLGGIGCVKVYMDGNEHPAPNTDQRYIKGVLPATWDMQSQTQRSGKFYFGNVTKGVEHSFKVSADDGKTFLKLRLPDGSGESDTMKLTLPYARKDAAGEFKSFLVLFGIDVPGTNPMPASCPEDE